MRLIVGRGSNPRGSRILTNSRLISTFSYCLLKSCFLSLNFFSWFGLLFKKKFASFPFFLLNEVKLHYRAANLKKSLKTFQKWISFLIQFSSNEITL